MAAVALVDNVQGEGFDDGIVPETTTNEAINDQSGYPQLSLSHVTVQQDERQISAILNVNLPREWVQGIEVLNNEPLFTCGEYSAAGLPVCSTSEDVSNRVFEIYATGALQKADPPSIDISLEDIAQQGAASASLPIELASIGTPLNFPSDEYRVPNIGATIRFPSGVFSPNGLTSIDLRFFGNYSFLMQGASGLGDYEARILPPRLGSDLVVTRRGEVRFAIYAIALAPLLLVAIAAREWKLSRDAGDNSNLASLEVAVALFALIPLREALAPAGLGGLTRLDYILTGEVVFIISLFTVTAIVFRTRSISTSSEPPTRGLDERGYR